MYSAGKSSLIESISQINLPKKSGTCTRCPMEIKLKDSTSSGLGNEWNCRVILQKSFAYQGTSARPIRITPSRPYGPWARQEVENYLFAELDDKDDVERTLRLAQLATLNPGSSPEKYSPSKEDPTIPDDMEVKFSPNVVRVEVGLPAITYDYPEVNQLQIRGPGLSDLAFYDLPGVINASQRVCAQANAYDTACTKIPVTARRGVSHPSSEEFDQEVHRGRLLYKPTCNANDR